MIGQVAIPRDDQLDPWPATSPSGMDPCLATTASQFYACVCSTFYFYMSQHSSNHSVLSRNPRFVQNTQVMILIRKYVADSYLKNVSLHNGDCCSFRRRYVNVDKALVRNARGDCLAVTLSCRLYSPRHTNTTISRCS